MEIIDNKFRLEDLYIGMEIKDKDQLSGIYDTWIMLVKNNDSDVYTVGFIGKETNAESDKLFTQGNGVCPVYNDSMELKSITFQHRNFEIDFGGVNINKDFVKVSYDRTGNILIGMDVLSQMDIHIGKSKILGKTVFIACPYESMKRTPMATA